MDKRTVRIVFVSPSDVLAERETVPAVIDELNRGIAAQCNLRLELYCWRTDAYPGFHPEGPQGLIDPILNIEDCDLLVAVFWRRFGTPTSTARAGTEHEILRAYEGWKQNRRPAIMVYFNQDQPPSAETQEEVDQWRQVLEFKKNFPEEGLWWEYEGKDQFEKYLRNHLTQFIRNQPSPGRQVAELIKEYLAGVTTSVSKVYIPGETEARPLEQVFVELSIIETTGPSKEQTKSRGLSEGAKTEPVEDDRDATWPAKSERKVKLTLKPDELLRPGSKAVITGAAGCGKTTLLRYLACRTLAGYETLKRLPVFIELKTVSPEHFKESQHDLGEWLFDVGLAGALVLTSTEREQFREFFLRRLANGEVAIFLDGLDEISGADLIPQLCVTVGEFVRRLHTNNSSLISTRPHALPGRLAGLKHLQIDPLNERQIKEFLVHYYGDTPDTRWLLRTFRQRSHLRELLQVPFLLAVVAQLYRQHHEIVAERLELYRQIVWQLIVQLDREKQIVRAGFRVTDRSGGLKLDFLKYLAYERLFNYDRSEGRETSRLVFTGAVIRRKAQQFCQTRGRATVNSYDLADDVKATPLLREVGPDAYSFSHLTIQEYLAALEISERANCEALFCRAYFNPSLVALEVLPMILGLVSNADVLYEALEQLPESFTLTGLRLRARGLAYVRKLDKRYLAALGDRLIALLTERNPDETPFADSVFSSFPVCDLSSENVVHHLAVLLKHGEINVRRRTASILGRIGGKQAVPVLIDALKDRETTQHVAEALGETGDERAVDFLLQALNDETYWFHRDCIVHALARLGDKRALATLLDVGKKLSLEQDAVARAVIDLDRERSISSFVESLKNGKDSDERQAAVLALTEIGNELAVEALIGALDDKDEDVRAGAAEALGKIGDETAGPALAKALKDKDGYVRCEAAQSLGKIGEQRQVPRLINALKDKEAIAREGAAIALGKLDDKRAVPALIEALSDREFGVRMYAAEALGNLEDDRAVPALVGSLMMDKNGDVRGMAADALGLLADPRAIAPLLSVMRDQNQILYVRYRAVNALAEVDPENAVPLFLEILDEVGNVRDEVIEILGRIGGQQAFPFAMKALNDPHDKVRKAAAQALGTIADERAVPGLIRALDLYVSDSSKSAAKALGRIGNERAVAALLGVSGAEPANVADSEVRRKEYNLLRQTAAESLASMESEKLTKGLVSALSDRQKHVRRRAAQMVGYYAEGEKALHALSRLAAPYRSKFVRSAAAEARERYRLKLKYFHES